MSDGIFEGWAIVEQLGHMSYAAFVRQISMGTEPMLRLDIPSIALKESWQGLACVVPAFSLFIHPGTIYALHPCSEEYAKSQAVEFAKYPPGFVRETNPNEPPF